MNIDPVLFGVWSALDECLLDMKKLEIRMKRFKDSESFMISSELQIKLQELYNLNTDIMSMINNTNS